MPVKSQYYDETRLTTGQRVDSSEIVISDDVTMSHYRLWTEPELIAKCLHFLTTVAEHMDNSLYSYSGPAQQRWNSDHIVQLLRYLFSGEVPTIKISYKYDLMKALDFYSEAPPEIQYVLEPIISAWKFGFYDLDSGSDEVTAFYDSEDYARWYGGWTD